MAPTQVLLSVIGMTLAGVLCTIGVWAGRLLGRLKAWRLALG